jgi:hypothetical protein
MYDLVVTNDNALLIYLHSMKIVDPFTPVKYPVAAKDVIGKHVIGNLPHALSSVALSYTEIPLHLPPQLIDKVLIPSDYDMYADKPVTYKISKMYTYYNEWEND